MSEYVDKRKDYIYYKFLKELLCILSSEDDEICDVGSCGVDMLSFLNCKRKISIDLETPYIGEDVESIKGDFLGVNLEKISIYTCFQVLEHIGNNEINDFAEKLLQASNYTVISVPYMWEKGKCKSHIQDPVDEIKVKSWFERDTYYKKIITEKNGIRRMVCVYKNHLDNDDSILRQLDVLSQKY